MSDPHSQATPTDPGESSITTGSDTPIASTAPTVSTTPEASTAPTVTLNRPGRLLLRVVAVVIVIVVGVIVYLVFFQKSDPTAAKVGDCVSISGSASLATAQRLSCDDESALYVVTAAGKSVSCDANEVSYTGSNRDRTKLCLFYNVRVGDCLTLTQKGDGDARGTCAPGMVKVVSVRTDTAEESQCPAEADVARADATRKRLICFATVR
jgi:hypothetical protein